MIVLIHYFLNEDGSTSKIRVVDALDWIGIVVAEDGMVGDFLVFLKVAHVAVSD